MIFWIGIWPNFFLSRMHASVDALLERVASANAVRIERVQGGLTASEDGLLTEGEKR
jgi:hypothetical protein